MSDPAVTIELPAGALLTLPPEAVDAFQAALRAQRQPARVKRDLAADIEQFLTAGSPTVPAIARSVGTRDQSVRHVLQTNPRSIRAPATSDRSPRARLWMLASGLPGVVPDDGTSTRDEGL